MRIDNDFTLMIATGRSCNDTAWRNKKIRWSAFLERIKEPYRTHETVAEYAAMKKADKDKIKDVGGFVGGYVKEGKRKTENVSFRSIVTLDIDFGEPGIWDDFTMEFDCAAAIYSTHKHTPEAPRYRLVVPLSRNVEPEEYEPIARYIAAKVGIEYFDDTTYQIARLFYWQSTPADGEYVFEYQDGPALVPDEVLETYHDWRDSSEWPYSSRVSGNIRRDARKQGDPLEKPGIIGAFCRAHSATDVLENILSDKYEPTAIENRYTYKGGTTYGGVVVYDDKFVYSHHATDPASMTLCNAFDLVRIHLFGHLDDGTDPDRQTNKRPSFAAMEEYAAADRATKKILADERISGLNGDFDDVDVEAETEQPEGDDWRTALEVRRDGRFVSSLDNMVTVLRNDPRIKGRIYRDIFAGQDMVVGRMPWDKTRREKQSWTNADEAHLRHFLESEWGMTGKDKVKDAYTVFADSNRVHPVRDYLNGLKWDGTPRLDTALIDYLGATDTELVRAVTRMQFTAAVARIFEPGIKYDYVLVLTGSEGKGKTTFITKMGYKWYSASLVTMEGKDGMEAIRGNWIIEIGELVGMKKSEVESVKSYLSKQSDKYRPAYGTVVEEYPRQCVFFATTNEEYFLKGYTGNRRFFPVKIGVNTPAFSVWEDLTDEIRDQLWAEAVVRYRGGGPLFLKREFEERARMLQDEYNEVKADENVGGVAEYLDVLLPADWNTRSMEQRRAFFKIRDEMSGGTVRRDRVCAGEILVEYFGEKIDRYRARYVGELMGQIPGWRKTGKRARMSVYGIQSIYERVETEEEDDDL